MFNSPRDTNFNPNDNTSNKTQEWARYILWTVIGHPTSLLSMFLVVVIDVKIGLPWELVAMSLCLIPATEILALRQQIGPHQLVMWANLIRFRRRWFLVWRATVNARADHTTQGLGLLPVLGLIPRFKGNIGYFAVRPPAGQTLEFVADLADPIAAQYKNITQIEILYKRPTSTKGTLQIIFGNTNPATNPNWTTPPAAQTTATPPVNEPTNDLQVPVNEPTSDLQVKDLLDEPV